MSTGSFFGPSTPLGSRRLIGGGYGLGSKGRAKTQRGVSFNAALMGSAVIAGWITHVAFWTLVILSAWSGEPQPKVLAPDTWRWCIDR